MSELNKPDDPETELNELIVRLLERLKGIDKETEGMIAEQMILAFNLGLRCGEKKSLSLFYSIAENGIIKDLE